MMQVTPTDQARRGSGRSMATILAAQLWATNHKVALFQFGAVPDRGLVADWLRTLRPEVQGNICVFGVRTLDEVHAQLRGRRFEKVLVDHAIVERSEADLASRIERLNQEHRNQLANLEVIR